MANELPHIASVIMWTLMPHINPRNAYDVLGFIPEFLHGDDPRPAAEQFNENYSGGWKSFKGFSLDGGHTLAERVNNPHLFALKCSGDPDTRPVAYAVHNGEIIVVYESAWVAIFNMDDGSFDVARLD